jgi:hypothetical protein
MANIIRSAKSGSDWTENDLRAFNIRIEHKSQQDFFGTAGPLPDPDVSEAILTSPTAFAKEERHFFHYMEDALRIPPGEESLVDDFTAFLLRVLRYDVADVDGHDRIIHTHKEMGFLMCGNKVNVKTDVYVAKRLAGSVQYLLLIQEDKACAYPAWRIPVTRVSSWRHLSPDYPVPQLIAEAIAAFTLNNVAREKHRLTGLESYIFPGITMIGTTPTFFKISITETIRQAIACGEYSEIPTVVECFIADLPNLDRQDESLRPVENRQYLLRCFKAFKAFMVKLNIVKALY